MKTYIVFDMNKNKILVHPETSSGRKGNPKKNRWLRRDRNPLPGHRGRKYWPGHNEHEPWGKKPNTRTSGSAAGVKSFR